MQPATPTATHLLADARHLPLATATVDLVVTSIPFYGIRAYTNRGQVVANQIGIEGSINAWLANMWAATAETRRVLRRTGSAFLHIQDKFNSDDGGRNYKDEPGAGGIVPDAGYKSLILIPQRFILGLIDPDYAAWTMSRAGWQDGHIRRVAANLRMVLRSEIIIWRTDGIPEAVHDRVRRQHEYLFHLVVDGDRYFADLDPLRTAQKHLDHRQLGKRLHVGTMWTDTVDTGTRTWAVAERALDERGSPPVSVWEIPGDKLGLPPGLHHDDGSYAQLRTPAEIVAAARVHLERGDEYQIRPMAKHTAPFSAEIVRRCVEGWCPKGWTTVNGKAVAVRQGEHVADTRPAVVLDPFNGTGKTTLVAKTLGRTAIGVDLSRDYTAIAQWRCNSADQASRIRTRANKAAQTTMF